LTAFVRHGAKKDGRDYTEYVIHVLWPACHLLHIDIMRSRVQGVSAPLVGAACENACLFLTYNKFQDIILSIRPSVGEVTATDGAKIERRQLSLGELALAAGAAGAAASFLL
jgi:hypothetical protein